MFRQSSLIFSLIGENLNNISILLAVQYKSDSSYKSKK